MRRFLASCALAVIPAVQALAQCPDGSPRPCRSTVRIDTNVFVVLPFAVSGPPSAQYLGPSMVDLLHMALDGVGRTRVEYAPTNLRRIAEFGPAEARAASGVAVELGAGRVIGGTIVAIGSDIRIRADVFDAIRNRHQFSVEAKAKIENLTAVVDSLAASILARRLVPASERTPQKLAEYATRSPEALQLYLVARQLSRRGERRTLAESLKVALGHDPDFGLAYLLLWRTESAHAGITGVPRDSILSVIAARKSRFPERIRFMFDDARRSGDRLRNLSWAREAVARYPDDADAAFYLADAYFHDGLNLGESRDAVVAAFRRAIALDDQDPELLLHFATLLAEAGDSSGTKDFMERCLRRAPSVCGGDDLSFRAQFRREDPHRLATGPDSLFWGTLPNYILRGTPWDPTWGLALTDSFAQIQTSPSRTRNIRGAAYVVRSNVALARGQYDLAWSFLDSAKAAAGADYPNYVMLNSIVTGLRESEASAVRINPDAPVSNSQMLVKTWWVVARQPLDSGLKYLKILETRAHPDSTAKAFVAGLHALVALRSADTNRALAMFTEMRPYNRPVTVPNRVVFPGTAMALRHAQVETARGNFAKAKLLLADVYPLNNYVPFIAEAEELRASVALALGDTSAARTHLRNVIAVWDKADPQLQPRVEASRAILARLGQQ
jgi:tetratricopeptide (TPR) repeat protein